MNIGETEDSQTQNENFELSKRSRFTPRCRLNNSKSSEGIENLYKCMTDFENKKIKIDLVFSSVVRFF